MELTQEDKMMLVKFESEHDGEIIPIENQGVKQCLLRDNCLAIFKNKDFRPPPTPTVLLVTEDGAILGQEIFTEKEKKKFKEMENSHFLSEEFVLFDKNMTANKSSHSKEIFLLPPVAFPEVEEIEESKDVVSSSPSTKSDDYLKEKYGIEVSPKIATILVGFSAKNE
ncbi:MAG: hypothetical protein KO202_02630 [Methanobacteriaceae archaeon]|nr:hypothetical protein [Methanobacteriaceae archaeon]